MARTPNQVFTLLAAVLLIGCPRSDGEITTTPGDVGDRPQWARAFAATGTSSALDVAISKSGKLAVVGTFEGSFENGDHDLRSNGLGDALVALYSSSGERQWVRAGGGLYNDRTTGVAFMSDGSLVVAGETTGKAKFGDEVISALGRGDVFVAHYSAKGDISWLRRIPTTGYAAVTSIAVTTSDTIVVSGYYAGALQLVGRSFNSAGSQDGFVAEFDSDGVALWARRFGGSGADTISDVAIGASGRIAVAGSFTAAADISGTMVTAPADSQDALVLLLEPNGDVVWVRALGGPGSETATAVAIARDDEVTVVGTFSNDVSMAGRALRSNGGTDIFLVRFAGDGVDKWSRSYGGPGFDSVSSLEHVAGGYFLAGNFEQSIRLARAHESVGKHDIFVALIDEKGEPMWSRTGGGRNHDSITAIAANAKSSVGLSGSFEVRATFGASPMHATGGTDGFAAYWSP